MDGTKLVKSNRNINFINNFAINISYISVNSEPTDDNHAIIKSYVDFSSENNRNRRDL